MSYIPDAISVVIPTYNRALLIKASIQSVLEQTLQPYEIIVVDDFSTDNTEEVVNSFNSPLIKYVKNQRKKGANGARNTGILMAKGELIAFHDSDDIWFKLKLEKQMQFLKNTKSDMCFCSFKRCGDIKEIIVPIKKVNSYEIKNKILKSNFISTQTILVKKIYAEKNLFDENLKRFQDWDFVIRLIFLNIDISHLNDVLVQQNINNSSISVNTNYYESYMDLIDRHPILLETSIPSKLVYLKMKKNKSLYDFMYFIFLYIFSKFYILFNRM